MMHQRKREEAEVRGGGGPPAAPGPLTARVVSQSLSIPVEALSETDQGRLHHLTPLGLPGPLGWGRQGQLG